MELSHRCDGTLSVILSKAFLLAADTKITDPTIMRQIGKGGGAGVNERQVLQWTNLNRD